MHAVLSEPGLPRCTVKLRMNMAVDNIQELTAEAAAARQAAATAEAETARVRGKSEDIQRKARSALLSHSHEPARRSFCTAKKLSVLCNRQGYCSVTAPNLCLHGACS